jgi:DHA1 family multidrug resistance protein-like MFS transporter
MAYISDSTSEEERGGGMGILGAAVGLGTILGPGLGGLLGGEDLTLPFFIAGGMSFLTLLLIALFLPESLPPEARQRSKKDVDRMGVRELWAALFSSIGTLLFAAFILSCGLTIFYGIFGLYVLEKFGYGPEEVGTTFMVIGLVSAVVQGTLTGPATKRWGEAAVIKFAMLAASGAFALMLLADTFPTVLLTTGFLIFATALLIPAVTSLTSKHTTTTQGIAMGMSNSFMSLGRIAGPLWAGFAFDLNITYPYISGALVMLVGFVISLTKVTQESGDTTATAAGSGVESQPEPLDQTHS